MGPEGVLADIAIALALAISCVIDSFWLSLFYFTFCYFIRVANFVKSIDEFLCGYRAFGKLTYVGDTAGL